MFVLKKYDAEYDDDLDENVVLLERIKYSDISGYFPINHKKF